MAGKKKTEDNGVKKVSFNMRLEADFLLKFDAVAGLVGKKRRQAIESAMLSWMDDHRQTAIGNLEK